MFDSARNYDSRCAGVDKDLALRLGPIEPVLAQPIRLSAEEFENLVAFVRTGLLDVRAESWNLCSLIPVTVPSGMPPLRFEECPQSGK